MYPVLTAEHIQQPNRLFAVPFVGIFVKSLLLIPVAAELTVIAMVLYPVAVINSFVVLLSGNYWRTAYDLVLGFMRLELKAVFYVTGLTDRYPGFTFDIPAGFSLDIEEPTNPSKLFAIPIIGGVIRYVLMIPYGLYAYIILEAAYIGVFFASFPVLFVGKYPESIFEMMRDGMRLSLASASYALGLSDKYPSFSIPWTHSTIKTILIVVAVLNILPGLGGPLVGSLAGLSGQQEGPRATVQPPRAQVAATQPAATARAQAAPTTRVSPGAPSPVPQVAAVPQRATPVNQRLTIAAVDDDQSALRQYFANVELTLVGVERIDERSSLWRFALWNHNTSDYLDIVPGDDYAYIVSPEGRRADALDWDGITARASEQKELVIAFAAPTPPGQKYTLVLNARAETGPSFRDTDMQWAPVEVTLQ